MALPVEGAPGFFVFEVVVVVSVLVALAEVSAAVALPVAAVVSAAPVLGDADVAAPFAPPLALFIVDSVVVVPVVIVSVRFSTGFVHPTAAIERTAAIATAACVLVFM